MTGAIPMNLKMEWRPAQDADSVETRALDTLLASNALVTVLRQENLKLKMDILEARAERDIAEHQLEEYKRAKKPKPRRKRTTNS